MSLIEVNDLHFSYSANDEVLKGIDLQFNGETTAIVGQNGAGKSTFVKLLKGLLKPTNGDIRINDKHTKNYTAAELAKDIGMVFQNPSDQIFKHTVISEVMFGPLNIGQSEAEARNNAINMLKKVELHEHLETNPYDLSLSERKMIAIASVLAMDPAIVIFDEPTMGQDFAGKERLKEIILELRDQGKLVICILHDMDFAVDVFERTIVFNEGTVLLDGPSEHVFSQKEKLEHAHLEQPHVAQLASALGLKENYFNEGGLVEALRERLKA